MWSVKTFSELTTTELYAIYKLRVKTFVVEQQRVYQEVDDIDPTAVHIFLSAGSDIVAYARVFKKTSTFRLAGWWSTNHNAVNTGARPSWTRS
ncbi:GNAT family N-acetyltransferase [Lactiplantibacillus carotarum]|uniref:hypothetical protein n=1 Tax=Lactiplantibacillus carotarum TaxID=2993456 RepID=UPI00298F3870|nr:hypothetical protein [Lactiplantibacillus carotarum]